MTPEEMLDIFIEETGIDESLIKSYGVISKIVEKICNKPLVLKRKALFVAIESGQFKSERIYVSDRYPLVTEDDEKEVPNVDKT